MNNNIEERSNSFFDDLLNDDILQKFEDIKSN